MGVAVSAAAGLSYIEVVRRLTDAKVEVKGDQTLDQLRHMLDAFPNAAAAAAVANEQQHIPAGPPLPPPRTRPVSR